MYLNFVTDIPYHYSNYQHVQMISTAFLNKNSFIYVSLKIYAIPCIKRNNFIYNTIQFQAAHAELRGVTQIRVMVVFPLFMIWLFAENMSNPRIIMETTSTNG